MVHILEMRDSSPAPGSLDGERDLRRAIRGLTGATHNTVAVCDIRALGKILHF